MLRPLPGFSKFVAFMLEFLWLCVAMSEGILCAFDVDGVFYLFIFSSLYLD